MILSPDRLTRFCEQLLIAGGFPDAKARLVAKTLVAANLRGVDSHGVQMLPFYVDRVEGGDIDPRAEGRVISENGPCLLYHGENGIGQWISDIVSGHAIRLAKQYGLGLAIARESNHFGAAAWWAQKMSAAGQIGIVLCNASPLVPPWQGKAGRLGTNPICVSVPGPWLLDMATTSVAANKIFMALAKGQAEIPAGWAMDHEGRPTTDPLTATQGLLMPLGGYKGSGLAMMVEILCGVLGGGGMGTELSGVRTAGRRTRVSQAFLAIEIERFMPVAEFTARMEKLVAMMKDTPPAADYDEIMVAGDPEWRMEAQRRQGIPVPEGIWDSLRSTALRLGVPVPGEGEDAAHC